MRLQARVDKNQKEIVGTLRELGYKVAHTHALGKGAPDIIVGGHNLRTGNNELLWVEIKSPGGKLTHAEAAFFEEWYDYPVLAAFSVDEILKWFGETEMGCELK